MDCERFARWLDDGLPAETDAGAREHAAACARCAAALATARALDAALERPSVVAPADFTAHVMERVARARLARLLARSEPDALPWWVSAAAEPVTALSLVLGALVIWQYPTLARLTATSFQALASPAVTTFMQQLAAPRFTLDLSAFSNPFVFTGLILAALPLAWWVGLGVYHWSGDPQALRAARRWCGGRALGRPRIAGCRHIPGRRDVDVAAGLQMTCR